MANMGKEAPTMMAATTPASIQYFSGSHNFMICHVVGWISFCFSTGAMLSSDPELSSEVVLLIESTEASFCNFRLWNLACAEKMIFNRF